MALLACILSFLTCLGMKARPFPSNSGGAPLCCCTRPHSERRGFSTTCQCVTRLGPLMSWERCIGMASVVCVFVKICVSSISLYKLDTDKLTAPFESAHRFTLVCTVSDSKTVPGCHYNLCSNHSFVLTD